MNNLLDLYELIDISSSNVDEGEIKRASTPLPRNSEINVRILFEVSNPSVEANADEEENFELSLESLESECKKLNFVNRTQVSTLWNRANTRALCARN